MLSVRRRGRGGRGGGTTSRVDLVSDGQRAGIVHPPRLSHHLRRRQGERFLKG